VPVWGTVAAGGSYWVMVHPPSTVSNMPLQGILIGCLDDLLARYQVRRERDADPVKGRGQLVLISL
jgi:hypothetical protein